MAAWPKPLFAALTGLSVFPVSACAQAPVPTGVGAEGVCIRLGMRFFPDFAVWFTENGERVLREQGISRDPVLPETPAVGIPMEFRMPDGTNFTASFPEEVRAAHPEANLTCVGDMAERRVTALHYNDQLRRPGPGEVWSF